MATGLNYVPHNPTREIRYLVFLAPPIIAWLIVYLVELDTNYFLVSNLLAVATFEAIWGVTEIVQLAITSLVQCMLFPITLVILYSILFWKISRIGQKLRNNIYL